MSNDDLDPDVQAMKRANKRPLFVALGALALALFWVFMGFLSVRAGLEDAGYSDVSVTMNSPVEFGFTAKKGDSQCGGTVQRFPFFTSRNETCFGGR